MISLMPAPAPNPPPLDTALLKPGLRLAVGVSGGADSVALLRALHAHNAALGLVLHVAHLHHGLRGRKRTPTSPSSAPSPPNSACPSTSPASTRPPRQPNPANPSKKPPAASATSGSAASWLRAWPKPSPPPTPATTRPKPSAPSSFAAPGRRASAASIPQVVFPEGRILRPLLAATRAEVEAYLAALGQPWREDSSNRHLTYTRNRIRHELLPLLETWNPRLRDHLAQMAVLARDEEAWWQSELARLAPQVLLPGKPVRGGGRASGSGLALDVTRLAALAPALQRRLLRHAAAQLGVSPDFPSTEALRSLALEGRAGQRRELAGGLRAERTPRELRLAIEPPSASSAPIPDYTTLIPGEILAPAFGLRLRIDLAPAVPGQPQPGSARLRNWKPGDRVRLRYSGSPRKVKEVLERLRVTGADRTLWPVLEVDGRIVWMKGVELEPEQGIAVAASPLD